MILIYTKTEININLFIIIKMLLIYGAIALFCTLYKMETNQGIMAQILIHYKRI